MNLKKINRKVGFYLLLIIILAAFLRFYKLDQIPPSLNWDEAAAGYNAYTLANWGKDEWGQTFPLIFTSFKDDKHPVHIYTTAILIKIFGMSDFVTRSPGALFGSLSVIIIFFLAKILFKSNTAAFSAAFFLAISPYNLQFSRGLWEINFALFYFMLGLWLFFYGLEKKNWALTLSFLAFDLSLLSYHSSIVVVPIIFLTLITLYFRELTKLKTKFYLGLTIFLILIVMMVLDPRLAGLARVNQTKFSDDEIQQTQIFKKTHNQNLAFAEIVSNQYLKHFSWNYLYQTGDQNPRNSIKILGEFYQFEAPLFLLGLIFLVSIKSRKSLILLVWLLVAPLPSALVQGAPNASRALFMMGIFQLLEGLTLTKIISLIKIKKQLRLSNYLKYSFIILVIIIAIFSLKQYTDYYFWGDYAKKDAVEWQYGMKQVVQFFQKYPDYSRIYVTDVRSQPYIFFLYYLKYPLPKYLSSVQYNQDPKNNKFNLIYSFDKYQFGGWDQIKSMPDPGLSYVIEDSKYGGLAHINDFARVEKIKNPDGSVAFYIVSKY